MSEKYRGLFIPDTHFDNRTPGSRIDDYLSTTMEEFYEILYMARKLKCHYIVHLGDVFHRPDPMGVCRNQVLEALSHDLSGEPWEFDKFVVVGNHDTGNCTYDLKYSALGTLIKVGAIQKVDYSEKYGVAFGHFEKNIEKNIKEGMFLTQPAVIWATHAMVLKQGGGEQGEYVEFSKTDFNPECKLLINGHVHAASSDEKNGVQFINPGSIARNELNDDNLYKVPQVVVVDYYRDGSKIRCSYQPLKNIKPGSDIFNYIEVKKEKLRVKEVGEYMEQIANMTTLNLTDNLFESLRLSGIKKQVDEDIIDLAIQELKIVEDADKFS